MTTLIDTTHDITETLHESPTQDLLATVQNQEISSWRLNGIESFSYRLGLSPLAMAQTMNNHILQENPIATSNILTQFQANGYSVAELMSVANQRYDITTTTTHRNGEEVSVTIFDISMKGAPKDELSNPKTETDIIHSQIEKVWQATQAWFTPLTEIQLLSRTLHDELTRKHSEFSLTIETVQSVLAEEVRKRSIDLPEIKHENNAQYDSVSDHVSHMSKVPRNGSLTTAIKQDGTRLTEVAAYNALYDMMAAVKDRILTEQRLKQTEVNTRANHEEKASVVLTTQTLPHEQLHSIQQAPNKLSTETSVRQPSPRAVVPSKSGKLIDTHTFEQLCELHSDFISKALEKTQNSQFLSLFKDDQALLEVMTPSLKDAQEAARPQLESMKVPVTKSSNAKLQTHFVNRISNRLNNRILERGLAIRPLQVWQKAMNTKAKNEVYKSFTSELIGTLSAHIKETLKLPQNTSFKDLGLQKSGTRRRGGFIPAVEIQSLVRMANNSAHVPKDQPWNKDVDDDIMRLLEKQRERLKVDASLSGAQRQTSLTRVNDDEEKADLGLYALRLLSDRRQLEAMLKQSALDYARDFLAKK